MRIFVIRHGESQANIDSNIYKNIADHDIALSSRGKEQAEEAGYILKKFIDQNPPKPPASNMMAQQIMGSLLNFAGQQGHDFAKMQQSMFKARLWNSPYRRTRETAEIIGKIIEPHIKDTKEDVLLCEQQFGMFDGMSVEEQANIFPQESKCLERQKKSNGKFWARFPMGESPFDTAVRIRMFFGTLKRDEENGITDHIVICHGTVLKLFTMMWMHHKYEWFDAEECPGNCAIRLIDNNDQGSYVDRGYIFGGYNDGKVCKYKRNTF